MQILFVTSQFYPARETGSGISSSMIYKLLKKKHDVDLIIQDKKKYEEEYIKERLEDKFIGLDISYSKSIEHTLYLLKNNYDIRDGKYDIIHQYGGWKKAHLAKETRDFEETKVVTTLNGLTPVAHGIKNCLSKRHQFKFPRDFFCVQKTSENIKSLVDKYIFYKANTHFMSHYDKLFSQSKWIKDIYIKAGIPSDKIKVIGNFYDPQFYQDLKDSDINKKEDEDSTNILYVGRFSENKGVLDLIKAFDIVRKKMNVKLFLIGGGAQQKYFEELIEEMGLKDKIVMPGHVPYNEIIKYYSKGDIFVHPAKYPTEALNRTLMEAALSKTAIISSDVGTTPEVVGEDGLIYESGNIEKLADKIEKLGEDSGLRKKLSNQIFEKIKNSYSPEKIISDYEKEYYRLIEH